MCVRHFEVNCPNEHLYRVRVSQEFCEDAKTWGVTPEQRLLDLRCEMCGQAITAVKSIGDSDPSVIPAPKPDPAS